MKSPFTTTTATLILIIALSPVAAFASMYASGKLPTLSSAVATKNYPISAMQSARIDLNLISADEMREIYLEIARK